MERRTAGQAFVVAVVSVIVLVGLAAFVLLPGASRTVIPSDCSPAPGQTTCRAPSTTVNMAGSGIGVRAVVAGIFLVAGLAGLYAVRRHRQIGSA
jgi:hypothetical protein